MIRFGCIWPDGSYTGGITESQRDAAGYARQHDGRWYEIGGPDDPERFHASKEQAAGEVIRQRDTEPVARPPEKVPERARSSLWD